MRPASRSSTARAATSTSGSERISIGEGESVAVPFSGAFELDLFLLPRRDLLISFPTPWGLPLAVPMAVTPGFGAISLTPTSEKILESGAE